MENLESDAFVFFGATGDLAYEQIFPALQAMTRRGLICVKLMHDKYGEIRRIVLRL